MGTFQDRDGYKSHSDPSTSFKEQWQAQEYDQKLNQAPYLGYKPDDQPNSDDITFLNDDSYDDVQHKHAPYVKIEGDTALISGSSHLHLFGLIGYLPSRLSTHLGC